MYGAKILFMTDLQIKVTPDEGNYSDGHTVS